MRCFRAGRIVDSLRILTLKILGENRMDRATMNMTIIPMMMMICLGVNVEKWNYEHPYGHPYKDQQPRTR